MASSPNGKELAFTARDGNEEIFELRAISTSGSVETRTIYREAHGQMISRPVVWAPDGTRILFCLDDIDDGRSLWFVSTGGAQKPVYLEGGESCYTGNDIRIHPGGWQIAFVGGNYRGEVWMMK